MGSTRATTSGGDEAREMSAGSGCGPVAELRQLAWVSELGHAGAAHATLRLRVAASLVQP